MQVFVIPAFNEEANVPRLLHDLEQRPALWAGGHVLLVDDGSTDDTAGVAAAYDGPVPLMLVRQIRNQGPGRAFDRGFRLALELCDRDDDLVVTLESDTTSDLDALDAMLTRARSGADVVLASVHAGGAIVGAGRHRAGLSRAASFAVRATAGVDARTVSSFFRVYRAGILRRGYLAHDRGFIREGGFACKAEILGKLSRLDAVIEEIPVDLDAGRRIGESKLKVLPTMMGYTRLMARQVATRMRAPA
ncbi:glycosyltransferase family 2 protein [Baekduia soli]|uniref:Glycosyltransferase family 2 protein n=1 Tax=Baekduia soli TaxID=496014 RepID=A0A5B8UB96_9ACTN|nr:glycosyltransferase family 2 protein [Baekduia soli]QEC50098.1 glycosyltransferase family 2 protein [Baekduia soli]